MGALFASAAEELEYYKNYATKVECDLAEVQLTLEEFQMSSKELEEELEKEVENTERRYNEIRIRNEAMRQEVEEWKEKYQQSIKDSNTNINQLTRQLEVLKQQTEMFIKKERALEQDNDDLERTERATKWSLQELEIKYNVAMEKTVMLENEVSDKTAIMEDMQRLRDELRDANVELAVMKANQAVPTNTSTASLSSYDGSTTSLPEAASQRTTVGSGYEAMPSLRARLATLQRTTPRVPGSTSSANLPTSEAVPTHNPVRAVQDMVGRVKSLEARLASCRSLVTPLLQPPPSYSTSIPSSGRSSLQGSLSSSSSRPESPTTLSPTSSLLNSPKLSRRTSQLLQQHLQQHREQREKHLREQRALTGAAGLVST
ncbi:hypothetical protein B0O80DRAFT_430910 [Mortierella sp. GBAus27b]|nr:hypothetical protein B0O80DRAFT_430910 [Mortierella sp. GBAus27b]